MGCTIDVSSVCINRAFFIGIKGILTLLSEQGNLACCYLGTEPSLFVSPLSEPQEIDFKAAEQEMEEIKENNQIIKSKSAIHDVRLMIHVESPLRVSQNVFVFGSVMDGSQAIANVSLEFPFIPSSLKVTAHAAYTNNYGAPRVIDASALLPFSSIAKPCPPVKEAEVKILIDINKKPLLLNELFPDMFMDGTSYPGGALGIEYYSGHVVTIIPSKTAQRYRIQSDQLSSLWLVVSELVRRLQHKFRKEPDNSKLICGFNSSLPLQEYFKIIEEHFTNHSTPSPLNNLDTLLEATHRQIMSVTETMDRHLKALESSCCTLSSATNLIMLLIKLSIDMKEEEWMYLSACFLPLGNFDSYQGWEEKVNIALIYLLKHCLGKGYDVSKLNANEIEDMTVLESFRYVDNAPTCSVSSSVPEDSVNGNIEESKYDLQQDEYGNTFDDIEDGEMII
ncbi:protein PTHB1 [Caerostris extrusa]|uniref:Protein PTHB1 n=1 Tax=Caerostris extrusa TaxID=172846 RepID=A0AAV4X7Y6_CAEEX|nr:protein PTHB1 [Caerostris extrusa]